MERANLFSIHAWDNADNLHRLEELLRASDPALAHYSLPPERAIPGTDAQVRASIESRIAFSTAVVVVNSPGLHERELSTFEMETAVALNKRIVLVQPHDDFQLPVPAVLDGHVYYHAPWRSDVVGRAIRGEYPADGRVFDIAEVAERRVIIGWLSAGVAAASFGVIVRTVSALQALQRELAEVGVTLRWRSEDSRSVGEHAVMGALIVGGITALITGDAKTALYAAGAGAAAGAAIGVHRVYQAQLLGTAELRILTVTST